MPGWVDLAQSLARECPYAGLSASRKHNPSERLARLAQILAGGANVLAKAVARDLLSESP